MGRGFKRNNEICRRKFRHEHYLTALHHAQQLGDANIVIYPCGICLGLHLGHAIPRHTHHCEREQERRIASLQKRIAKREAMLREQERMLLELKKQLDQLMVAY